MLEKTWNYTTVLPTIWKLRVDKSRVQLYEVRAQLEAKINLLRETRFRNSTVLLNQFVLYDQYNLRSARFKNTIIGNIDNVYNIFPLFV